MTLRCREVAVVDDPSAAMAAIDPIKADALGTCVGRSRGPRWDVAAEGREPEPFYTRLRLAMRTGLLLRLVDQNSASWNRITGWLRAIDSLRNAA